MSVLPQSLDNHAREERFVRWVRVEDLENKSEALCKHSGWVAGREANPSVPVLSLSSGKIMIESDLVMNYFCCNETYPGVDLRPKTVEQRYDGQLFENTFNTVVPAFFKCLRAKNKAELESAISEVEHALTKADRCLQMNPSLVVITGITAAETSLLLTTARLWDSFLDCALF